MSIYGKRKTALGLNAILGQPQGQEVLHLMINLELSLQIAGSFLGDLCDPAAPIPPSQIAQQNDGDIVLVIAVTDGATGAPVDLSSAESLTILLKKPDLTATYNPAALSTNGRDGKMQIALGPLDLDQAGYYFAQANFTVAAIGKSTSQGTFEVSDNIEVPEP